MLRVKLVREKARAGGRGAHGQGDQRAMPPRRKLRQLVLVGKVEERAQEGICDGRELTVLPRGTTTNKDRHTAVGKVTSIVDDA